MNIINLILTLTIIGSSAGTHEGENRFPDDFILGVATAAYQIEGAWNVSNKGESIWDRMTHQRPHKIVDRSNGDIADNSYYQYKEDIELIQQIGANAYRISLSWPRILPNGFNNSINKEGIQYYNNVINEMLEKNITPLVTIYHWDLPQNLQDLGGWENPEISNWFVEYARVVFSEFGDRVKHWITLNEPNIFCIIGYLGIYAPGLDKSGRGDYTCGHNALLAHAKTYKMYQEEFENLQQGKLGLVMSFGWIVPLNPDDPEEVAGAKLSWEFWYGWLLHPIFSNQGDYPPDMKNRIANYSYIQGFSRSRLPQFTEDEIKLVKNSADYLGFNFYAARYETKLTNYDINNVSFVHDIGMIMTAKPFTKDRCTPWAMSKIMRYINKKFKIPEIYITENGYWDVGGLNDVNRAEYYLLHLTEVTKLLEEGLNIRGYFAWSLLDNFEWSNGYTEKFGIISVNLTDPKRTRTPKLSSKLITQIYKSKIVPSSFSTTINITALQSLIWMFFRETFEVSLHINIALHLLTLILFLNYCNKQHALIVSDKSCIFCYSIKYKIIMNELIYLIGFLILLQIFAAKTENIKFQIKEENATVKTNFPNYFLLGAGSSAFQTEGAWNLSQKGESIWDRMIHQNPNAVNDKTNADVATNAYNMYKTDINLIKQINGNSYRISISWPRILPTGFSDYINFEGIQYYENVINEMTEQNITPVVTIYHWDLPQKLQELGGWANPLIVNWFVDYAKVLFTAFGDRVKYWITIAEPSVMCYFGYNGDFAPGFNQSGIGDYLCGHHALIAHAKTYRMYHQEFHQQHNGYIGIELFLTWQIAEHANKTTEVHGATLSWEFWNSWFLHPIFGKHGDYLHTMKHRVRELSRKQRFSQSRLPHFTKNQINMIQNSADFLGISFNHSVIIKKLPHHLNKSVSFTEDTGMTSIFSATPKARRTPEDMAKAIKHVLKVYKSIPSIIITKSGYEDSGELHDKERAIFYHHTLYYVLKLISEGVNIRGYFSWSLTDSFEWTRGYSKRYGIFSINFTDPELTRIPKLSSKVISEIYKKKSVEHSFTLVS
ncbi:lactase/phlorizin hydrolase-like [Cotesia typhae]|uniref:lactase/phlorizin hydrolase-like n=1 Tax=Cotesia typhae TaxID=2053667 RepID=UPI003D6861DD